jgi:hypothetical protein
VIQVALVASKRKKAEVFSQKRRKNDGGGGEFFCLSLDSVAPPLNALVPTFCPLKRHVCYLGLAWMIWTTVNLLTTVPTEILRRRGPRRSSHRRRGLNDSLKVEGEKGIWFVGHEPSPAFCEEHGTLPFVYSTVDLPRRIFLGLGNVTWLSGSGFRFLPDKVPR